MPLGLSENLFKRIISALSLLPIVLGAIYMGGWWFYGLLVLGGYLMITEWLAMHGQLNKLTGVACTFISALIPLMFLLNFDIIIPTDYTLLAIICASFIVLLFLNPAKLALAQNKTSIVPIISGIAYVGIALSSLMWLRNLDDNGQLVIWLFFAVWAMDVGGYFFGKGIGGPKLAPKLSPKKTWAGLIGGMFLSALIAAGLSMLLNVGTPLFMAFAGSIIAIVAQIGDLYESAIKRHMNIKDSGALIPGHGGILDRVDGLIFAAPFTAAYLAFNAIMNAG